MLTYSTEDQQFYNNRDPAANATAAVIAEIDKYADYLRSQKSGIGHFEAAALSEKLREARAHQVTPIDASAPGLAAEATSRGITTSALVTLVMTKAAKARNDEAQIAGIAGKHKDAVKAMPVDGVLTYDWRAGWPG